MRSAVAVLVVASSGVTGCALVSGLSDLDVGPSSVTDAAIDVKTDAGFDAIALDAPVALDARDGEAGTVVDAAKDADAGACPVSGADPAAVQSTCTTGNPIFAAGAIPAGTYALTMIREFPQTCTGSVPVSATGLLLVAVQGSLYALEERLTINGVTTSRHYTATVSGTTMTVALTCGPAIPSNQWQLNVSAGTGGKTSLVVYKTSPPTDQRFFWTQQ